MPASLKLPNPVADLRALSGIDEKRQGPPRLLADSSMRSKLWTLEFGLTEATRV